MGYASEHADHIGLSDLDGDGQPELRYAGSEDFFVCNTRGDILWSLTAGHSQQSIEGCWLDDGSRVIVLAEKNAGLFGVDVRGSILWNRKDINGYVVQDLTWPDHDGQPRDWGVFRPQLPPIRPAPYQSDPAWSRQLWPQLMDGRGQLHDFLPWQTAFAHPSQHIRCPLSYDCGLKYYPIALDHRGNGVDDVLIYNRQNVWVFTAVM